MSELDSGELAEWMAYRRIAGPLGWAGRDSQFASLRAMYRNAHLRQGAQGSGVEDMLLYPQPKQVKAQGVKRQIAASKSIELLAKATNGSRKSPKKSDG
jgi:hypothetical protein